MDRAQKKVGYFTEDSLREIAQRDNTVVMTPTHDIKFEAWPAGRVNSVVDRIVKLASKCTTSEEIVGECEKDDEIKLFSQLYLTFYKNLTDIRFVQNEENVKILRRIILLKAAVEQNMTSEQTAQAQVSDIALKSLMSRAETQGK